MWLNINQEFGLFTCNYSEQIFKKEDVMTVPNKRGRKKMDQGNLLASYPCQNSYGSDTTRFYKWN